LFAAIPKEDGESFNLALKQRSHSPLVMLIRSSRSTARPPEFNSHVPSDIAPVLPSIIFGIFDIVHPAGGAVISVKGMGWRAHYWANILQGVNPELQT
jgi:hypothetical protein